jgi:hypothetical protein
VATDLITRSEYKTIARIGDPAPPGLDASIDALIPMVTVAIKNYTDRDFGTDDITETRGYLYDGTGFLEIDDASNITSVGIGGVALPVASWRAMPYGSPVYTWVELPPQRSRSVEMGFLWNEDTYNWASTTASEATVTATFGWLDIPPDVKMAAVWTVAAWLTNPEPWVSEAIEGYSRSRSLPASLEAGIPKRAQRILDPYTRTVAL